MEITEELIEQHAKNPAHLRLELAVLMYEQEVWSLRKAAKFAGIHWYDFEGVLKKRDITAGIITPEELQEQVKILEALHQHDSSK